jgi:hypothetical protein
LVDELEARGAEADLSALVRPVETGNDWLMADAADWRDGEGTAVVVDQEAAVWRTA